jgi:hypothetical protein
MKRLFFVACMVLGGLWGTTTVWAAPVDLNSVMVQASKEQVMADGIDQSAIRVAVKTTSYLPAAGITVRVTSSRGNLDEFTPSETTTNGYGKAEFLLRSLKNGTTTVMVDVNGQRISRTVTVKFVQGLDIGLAAGSLIKIPSDSDPNTYADTAVYYYASNGRRYVFPNEKVYFSWYPSFEAVRELSIVDMSKIPIGGNVTYHPGVKPVKFQTDDKVYAVYRNGELRWLKTEAVAKAIYGEGWATKVDDISEAFYVNYHFGLPLENALDFMAETIAGKYSTIEKDRGL